jgi:hypothetical protein
MHEAIRQPRRPWLIGLGLLIAAFYLSLIFLASRGAAAQPSVTVAAVPTRNDFFVFAQGCVPMPGDNGSSCTNPSSVDWQYPLSVLRERLCLTESEFTDWLKVHVRFVKARTADYSPIAEAVASMIAGNGSLFLVGHSAGGAAIASYLLAQKAGLTPLSRVRGAYLLDSPLGRENLMQLWAARWASFYQADQLDGLGAWANAHNIDLRAISYADDWAINAIAPLADIPLWVVPPNQAWKVGPWELMLKHNYALFDLGGAHALLGNVLGSPACAP